jgi:hypothetical protein
MTNKSVDRIKKEAQKEAAAEIAEELRNSPKYLFPDPNAPKIDEQTKQPIIFAKDAEIGKDYLTVGFYYKVTLLKKYGDETHVSSVQIQTEGEYKPINVAGGTELIEYKEEFHKPRVVTTLDSDEDTTPPTNSKEKHKMPKTSKPPKASEQPQPKMSDIIVPMLAAAKYTATEIADAVIEKFPEKKSERDKLISQIAGPRLYNLLKDTTKWQNGKKPGLRGAESTPPSKKDSKKKPAKKETPSEVPENTAEVSK